MTLLSSRIKAIRPSPTFAITTKAKELMSQGVEILSLAAGEPDFDTPDNIKKAAIKAIENGETKYTNISGTIELRQAICNKYIKYDLTYNPAEVIVSCGGKQVIYNLFAATLDEGDEVIIPKPYWVSYPDIVILNSGKPVFVDSTIENHFKITAKELENKITDKSKWFILNSPSNPSGAVYSVQELNQITDILRKNPRINILCDDIYEYITFDDYKHETLATIAPDLKDRIFIINGVSKSYSMTGWRIGYGLGDVSLIKAMTKIQSQSTSSPCSISQAAALEAISGTQDFLKINADKFAKKRNLALSIFQKTNLIDCLTPKGAFYLFPNIKRLFGLKTPENVEINNCTDFAAYLLEKKNVTVIPGIAFGMEGYIRISFATSEEIIKKGISSIVQAAEELR